MGLWSGLKKSVKTVGGAGWGAVKWGGRTVKKVVEVPVNLLSTTGKTAEGVVTKVGGAVEGIAGGIGNFVKFLPWVIFGVIGVVVYFMFFKGGATTTIKAAT